MDCESVVVLVERAVLELVDSTVEVGPESIAAVVGSRLTSNLFAVAGKGSLVLVVQILLDCDSAIRFVQLSTEVGMA